MKLWEMSWEEAKEHKWEEGRKKYGQKWAGEPPLKELFAELVDASNYLDEAVRRGDVEELQGEWMAEDLRDFAVSVMAWIGPGEG